MLPVRRLAKNGFEAWSAVIARDQEHRRCGNLDGAVEAGRVWMTCTCGAVINRSADEDLRRKI